MDPLVVIGQKIIKKVHILVLVIINMILLKNYMRISNFIYFIIK